MIKNNKKLSGILLIVIPIVILLALSIYNIFNSQGNTSLSIFLNLLVLLFFVLSIIFLPLGIVLIVSSRREAKFSMKEVFDFGYDKMRKNFWFFVSVFIVYYLIAFSPIILEKIKTLFDGNNNLFKILSFLFFVALWVVQVIVNIGLLKIALSVVDDKKVRLSDLFSSASLFLNFLVASTLYSLIVLGGLVLFIIPGIIWQVKFSMFPYFVIEGYGPIESLKKSSQITKGAKADIFLLSILFGLLNIVGALLLFVGLFVTMPISTVGTAYIYRKLEKSFSEKNNI